jgi:exocyst complex component 6
MNAQVETSDEFEAIVNTFPFCDEALQEAPFPKRFPFSAMVPKVYHQVKEFIYACVKFSDDLNSR